MNFPPEYPQSAPKVHLKPVIFHPNVWKDGRVCLDIIGQRWTPALSSAAIVVSVIQMLDEPNPDSPANSEAAALYLAD